MFEPWAEREPYKTLHAHLHELLPKAHRIVIIGYAFHDKIVNAALAAALDANVQLRVLVVDPGIPRYVKRTDTRHRDAPFEFLKLTGSPNFRGRALPGWRGGSAKRRSRTRW